MQTAYKPHTVWVEVQKPVRADAGVRLDSIVAYISAHREASAKEIARAMQRSSSHIRKLLLDLLAEPKPVVRIVPSTKPLSQHNPNRYEICH